MGGYVELHCHSCYSLREGASTPVELLDRAAALGYDTLALTDHDNLHGAMEFARAAHERGIRPITGVELTLPDESHLTLLAASPQGYAAITRAVSARWGVGEPGPLQADGLILLTGCSRHGAVPRLVTRGDLAGAEALLRRYVEWLGPESVYVELQQNYVYGDTARNAALAELARKVGVGVVATNNVHYHDRERSRLHDLFVAIQHRTTLDASHQLRRANREFGLKSPLEMARIFREYPEAIRNSRRIAERCAAGFDLTRDLVYDFPSYDVPEGFTADSYLEFICWRAMKGKYSPYEPVLRAEAEARLREELALIAKHKLSGFFLTYRDIMVLAGEVAHDLHGRDLNLPPEERPVGRGRGSSVSSLVCYLIGLSHVDPVRNKLFLGRFLNEDLASVPDIDLDFPRDIRAALIERMYTRYPGRVALVCTLPAYRMRSAIRDAGKALGLPAAELDKLAKLSERYANPTNLAEEMRRLPDFADKVDAPLWRDLVSLAAQMTGFPRHISQHVGGMVLSAAPITDTVPLQPARMEGRFLCQWDKDSADDARFIKIDFLALGMLSLVDECMDTIEQRHGVRPDFSQVGYDDPAVYDRICAADTVGVFQIESRAQIQTLPHTQPRNLDDLAVEVAIIRPGPIIGGSARPYMEHRRRLAAGEPIAVDYDHPILEPVLKETLGVILFQEQVLQVAMTVASFSAGQAESLRRAMSRRRSEEAMKSHWPAFRDGAAANGVSEAAAARIFEKLLGFAAFGFPRSHAVAFARLAYESAWLRYKYPAEFYAALLNNQPMGFYSVGVLAGDAARHGIRMLRPHINRGYARCTVENDDSVRLGLSSIQGISVEVGEAIVAARADVPFRSLSDLLTRTDLSRQLVEKLIIGGALDSFGLGRRELLWQFGLYRRAPHPKTVPPTTRQPALPLPVEQDMVDLPPMTAWERLAADHMALGFSTAAHPLGLLRANLGEGIVSSRQVERMPHGLRVQHAGMVVCRQRPGTAKGVLFLLLEDEFGLTNVIVHPGLYEQRRLIVRNEPFLVVDGIVQRKGPTMNLLAREVAALRVDRDLATTPVRDFH